MLPDLEQTPSAVPENSSASDMEVLKKMEDEHLRLQRQVRMIHKERTHRTTGVHPIFRRQDKLLRQLKKEYLNLTKDLKIARSGAHKKKDKKMKSDLKNVLLTQTKMEMDCEGGVNLMEELDGLLRLNHKNNLKLRETVDANAWEVEERRTQSEHRLRSTENKLEAAMRRFNEVQAQNKKIRQEIEHMLKDRVLFNQAWSTMLSRLGKGKKFLTELFESSAVAYDQRDEWCKKLSSVQEKGRMDQMLQVQEMRDLQKALDNEMKLGEFLARKGVMRINKKQEQRDIKDKEREEEEGKKQLKYHEDILKEIYVYEGNSNIEHIISEFDRREQTNFSLYKLLTDVLAEIVVLSRDVERIQRDVVDRRDWNERKDSERDGKIQEIEEELNKQKMLTEQLKSQSDAQISLITRTMDEIGEIFQSLGCSLEPFENLLGDKFPSTWHLHLTLSQVTDRIQDLVQTVWYYERYLQKKKTEKSTSSRLKKFTVHHELPASWTPTTLSYFVPADPCPNCVEARWLSRVSEEREAPLGRALTRRALAHLTADPAYERSDRVHTLADCRLPSSRLILARRYM